MNFSGSWGILYYVCIMCVYMDVFLFGLSVCFVITV